MKMLRYALAGLMVVGLAACDKSPLEVTNDLSPDRDRALARPTDVQTLIFSSFNTAQQSLFTFGGGLAPQAYTIGMENYSGLANEGMNLASAMPRNPISNARGGPTASNNFNTFNLLHRAAAAAALGIQRLNTPGFSIGTVQADNAARAFAHFVKGYALGYVAMIFDSGSVVDEHLAPGEVPPMVAYDSVGRAAVAFLDSAVTDAGLAGASATYVLTGNGNGSSGWSNAQFIQVVRGIRARIRSGVARSPAERAAVDWVKVIADAQNGPPANVMLNLAPVNGWNNGWMTQHYVFQSWHMMYQFYMGMADSVGVQYDAWLATPAATRAPFLVKTADRRFPPGDTRALQNTNTPAVPAGTYGYPYIRNRPPGQDVLGDPLAAGYYDHYRFKALADAIRVGPFPLIVRAEMNLLMAEGYIRTANWVGAATFIDSSRVAAGLAPLTGAGIVNLTTPVPGGSSCVPRVPVGPNYTSSACGNIMEAMKWEKRMETAYTDFAPWWINGRGWGDLPEGTQIHWPVPYQEIDTRRGTIYTLGGVGGTSATPRGNYGL